MKTKNIKKKLNLNKNTVVSLIDSDMENMKGGDTNAYPCVTYVVSFCPHDIGCHTHQVSLCVACPY